MLKQLMKITATAGLLLAGSVYAEVPDFIVVSSGDGPTSFYYSGNDGAPPPIILVDGRVVNEGGKGGPPDCTIAENRPQCLTLQAVQDTIAGGEPPVIIIITSKGGATFYYEGNESAPAPAVWVNGEAVGQPQ